MTRPIACWLRPPAGARLRHHARVNPADTAATLGLPWTAVPWLPRSRVLPLPSPLPIALLAPGLSPHHPRRQLAALSLIPGIALTMVGPSSRYRKDAPRHVRLAPWFATTAYLLRHPTLFPPTDRPWVLPYRDRDRTLPDHPLAALYIRDLDALQDPHAVYAFLHGYPQLPALLSCTDPFTALWLIRLAQGAPPWPAARSHVLCPLRPMAPHLRWQVWAEQDRYTPPHMRILRSKHEGSRGGFAQFPWLSRLDGPRPPRAASVKSLTPPPGVPGFSSGHNI